MVGVGGPEPNGPGVNIPWVLVMQILGDAVLLPSVLKCDQLRGLGSVLKS